MHRWMIFGAMALATVCAAQEPKNMTFTTKLKSVAVFRDGYGFYQREGKAKLEGGWVTTNFSPTAIRGTIWIYPLDHGDRVDTVVTTKDNKIEFTNVADLKAKLHDKLGLKLMVRTRSNQQFEGELAKILDDMLLLKSGAAYSAIPYEQIASVSFVGFPVRIKLDTKEQNKTATIGMGYLQEGISWEPSYVLNVHHDAAMLTLRATMKNTTENLDKTEVLFVVGSPFIVNRGQTDILNLPAALGASLMPADSNAQPFLAEKKSPDLSDKQPSANTTLAGEDAGELYYYKKSDLSLMSGDVAMVTVFNLSVPVTPQFEWNADGDEVVYLLNIKNSGSQPLTAGPVFVMEDDKPIGQEGIKYTAAGSTAELRLSRGIGIRVEKSEAEESRGRPVRIGKTDFIPVTVKGTLTITNFRKDRIPVKVTKSARGRVTNQSDGGRVKQTTVLTGEPNPLNDMEWKVEVGAGETKTLTYTLEIYMTAEKAGSPPVQDKPDEEKP